MGADKKINTNDLTEDMGFHKKDPYQFPQPADSGNPLNPALEKNIDNKAAVEKTSEKEGLNQQKSPGDAGAYEGIQNQDKK